MAPKVSVVIPAYNAENYIEETLRSVFEQTYSDYEVIVVNDGSTDGTWPLLQRYAPKIKAFNKPNGGPASARNLAIKHSTGELIAFLDSDDVWVKEKLETQVQYLNQHPEIELVYSEALMIKQVGGEWKLEQKIGFTEAPTFCKLLYGDFIPNCTVMIRRRCVESVGLLDESSELISVEDYDYWLRVARRFQIAGIPQPLAYYRVRDESLVGEGKDIDRELSKVMAVLRGLENRDAAIWEDCGIDRQLLFAKLYIRAGFAWKNKGDWGKCFLKYFQALKQRFSPRVLRWIVAATILKRWS